MHDKISYLQQRAADAQTLDDQEAGVYPTEDEAHQHDVTPRVVESLGVVGHEAAGDVQEKTGLHPGCEVLASEEERKLQELEVRYPLNLALYLFPDSMHVFRPLVHFSALSRPSRTTVRG